MRWFGRMLSRFERQIEDRCSSIMYGYNERRYMDCDYISDFADNMLMSVVDRNVGEDLVGGRPVSRKIASGNALLRKLSDQMDSMQRRLDVLENNQPSG